MIHTTSQNSGLSIKEPYLSNHELFAEFRDVYFGYSPSHSVLQGMSFKIPRGKVTALMGVSGGGKTTVIRLLSGQYRANRGMVLFDGQDVGQLDEQGLYAIRRRLGMLFQFGALFSDLSTFDNVAFPLRRHTNLSESMIRDLVLMKLDAVGLRGARNLFPNEVSGGMARRIALARAIALDPDLMIYDEPFAGLDPISLGVSARLIRDFNRVLGLTTLLVSHDLAETFAIADHIIFLANGIAIAQGSPDELRESDDPMVKQFVNALPDGPVHFHYPAALPSEDYGQESTV